MKKNKLDIIADRIVAEVTRQHKIIAAPCEGALVDELRGTISRVRFGRHRMTSTEIILAGLNRVIERGDIERFDDEFGIVIALPNEWPPADLESFSLMSDEDFAPLYESGVLRHLRDPRAWSELSLY